MKKKRESMTPRVRAELEALGVPAAEEAPAVPPEELPWENGDGSLWTRPAGPERPHPKEQMLAWGRQAEELKALVPDFDLETEAADPAFRELLDKGLTVKQAFILYYFDRLMAAAIHLAAEETERRLVANLRARGQRPPENGLAGAGSFLLGGAAAGLTKQQRAEIAARARKGETVRL